MGSIEKIENEYIQMMEHVWPVIMYVSQSRFGRDDPYVFDFLQDVRMNLWYAFKRMSDNDRNMECKESTWAYIIADNVAKDILRKRKKRKQTEVVKYTVTEESITSDGLEAENNVYLSQLLNGLNENENNRRASGTHTKH